MKQLKNKNWVVLITPLFLVSLFSCVENNQMSGNPIFPGNYADPQVAVFENQYWIFPTRSADFDSQVAFDAFSSTDLVNWEKHENILDTTGVKWVRRALWAPAIVKKDSMYYLFFGANDIQHPLSPWWKPEMADQDQYGGIGIAVADRPEGPYSDYLGKPLISEFYNNAQPIDQYIFKDRENNYYIIYGGWKRCNIGKLNDDFTALVPFEDGSVVKEITPEGYVEGSVMFYRNNKVYFMWSEGNWTDSSYNVAYAIADSPFGPFDRIGNIFVQDTLLATGAGHNSVLNIPGTDDWYMVYHRRPVPNQHRDHRVTCIEYLHFKEDGSIVPVKMTREGVSRRTLK